MKIFKTKKYTLLSNILKYSFVFILASTIFMSGFISHHVNGAYTVGTKIENPLGDKGPQNIPDFIAKAIDIVLIIGVPIVVLSIIYSGFLFVTAQGNPEKLKKAKNSLLYSIIGAVLLLGAFVIANAIGKTVEDIKKGA